MSTGRPRRLARTGHAAGVSWQRLRARVTGSRGSDGDEGFTMVEMIVSLIIIGIIMTALGSFFVATVSATSRQGTSQSAVGLADDAMERVRGMGATAIVSGRDQSSSDYQWQHPVTGVASYLGDMAEWYDPSPTADGTKATLPTVGVTVAVNGLDFTENWYVGQCWQPLATTNGVAACGRTGPSPAPTPKTATTKPNSAFASFYRVVVAVTWSDSVCASSKCVFIATTLVSNAFYDPQFNSNLSASAPSVVNPNNRTNDTGSMVSLTLTSSGGAGATTWSQSGLPTGLTLAANVISGTPTAAGTFTVTVTATDQFQLNGTANFTWTIVAPPTMTVANQTTVAGSDVSYTPTVTGGATPLTWTASGLPAGISLNKRTGAMSGVPTAVAPAVTVTVTATDAQSQSATQMFTWTITPSLAVTTPADLVSAPNVAINPWTVVASGGQTSYTFAASNYPTGLSFSTSTGQFSGTPTTSGTFTTRVTVTDSQPSPATVKTNYFVWTVGALAIASPPNNLSSAQGATVTAIRPVATGGSNNYTWSIIAGSLPTDVSMPDPSTGVISGTTSAAGTYTFTLKVTDNVTTLTATEAITWTVLSGFVINTPNSNLFGTVTVAQSVTPTWTGTRTGGSITGTLPPGIGFDPATGALSGTPTTAGTYSFTINGTSSSGSASQSLTWTIYPTALVLTSPTTSTRSSGHGVAIAPMAAMATGGSGYYTWSATGLPPDITLAADGVFSGSPGTAGTYATVVTVTDVTGAIKQVSFSWKVT